MNIKKIGLLLFFACYQLPAHAFFNFRERAEQEHARREAVKREAEIRAIEEQYINDTIKVISFVCEGIWYCISASGKVIFQYPIENSTEKTIGVIGTCLLATASVVGLYKLCKNLVQAPTLKTPSIRIRHSLYY